MKGHRFLFFWWQIVVFADLFTEKSDFVQVFKRHINHGPRIHFHKTSWKTIKNCVRYKGSKFGDRKAPLQLFETFETFDLTSFVTKNPKMMTYFDASVMTYALKSSMLTYPIMVYATILTWRGFSKPAGSQILTCQSRPPWKNLHRHLLLGPAFSSDIAGDGPSAGGRLQRNRTADPLLNVSSSTAVPQVNPPASSIAVHQVNPPASPIVSTPEAPTEREIPEEVPAIHTLANDPRSSSDDVPRPTNDTRLIDMHPDQYVYLQEANETLRFIPERVVKPVRGVFNQLMRSVVNNPQDLLRWKKFFLLPMVLFCLPGKEINSEQASRDRIKEIRRRVELVQRDDWNQFTFGFLSK